MAGCEQSWYDQEEPGAGREERLCDFGQIEMVFGRDAV